MIEEIPGTAEKPTSPFETRFAADRAHRNKFFPKRKKPVTPTQIQGAKEDQRLLYAQRAFHIDMIERFPVYLARVEARVHAAEAERASLVEKHAEAPGKIVECDRMIASLERAFDLPPSKAAMR